MTRGQIRRERLAEKVWFDGSGSGAESGILLALVMMASASTIHAQTAISTRLNTMLGPRAPAGSFFVRALAGRRCCRLTSPGISGRRVQGG